eukprot:3549186-Rhodomonas_salina.1
MPVPVPVCLCLSTPQLRTIRSRSTGHELSQYRTSSSIRSRSTSACGLSQYPPPRSLRYLVANAISVPHTYARIPAPRIAQDTYLSTPRACSYLGTPHVCLSLSTPHCASYAIWQHMLCQYRTPRRSIATYAMSVAHTCARVSVPFTAKHSPSQYRTAHCTSVAHCDCSLSQYRTYAIPVPDICYP